ncbi:MAG: hypothetical protein KBT58_02590, partial [Bizionia sp.]|nr:hypothetical protein [Bizionia sp.]
ITFTVNLLIKLFMKKLLFVYVLMLFVSCSSDDASANQNVKGIVEYTVEASSDLTEVTYNNESNQTVTELVSGKIWNYSFEQSSGFNAFLSAEAIDIHTNYIKILFNNKVIHGVGCNNSYTSSCNISAVVPQQ